MLTSAKILLILVLFSLLLFGSHGGEVLEKNRTQSMAKGLKTLGNESVSLESEANLNSNKEDEETSNPRTRNSSFWDPSNKTHRTTDFFFGNLSSFNTSGSPRSTPMTPISPPLIHNFVFKLPLNSSVTAHPSVTSAISPEMFPWSLANDTMKTPDNNSITVSMLPPARNTVSVKSTTEADGWLTTPSDSNTPYQETTPQPTLKFTNNSKIFPNTSDSQEENRNTGIVSGAILGAILGASLLSLAGYLLCGKRKTDSFSHRRLYDDRNEPVLRLDNAPDPYDVSFGNSSYYNPTENDSSSPAGQENAHDSIPMDDIPPLHTSV